MKNYLPITGLFPGLYKKTTCKLLVVIALWMGFVCSADAWDVEHDTKITWRPSEGVIQIDINYFQTYGGSWDGFCGFVKYDNKEDNALTLDIDGTIFEIYGGYGDYNEYSRMERKGGSALWMRGADYRVEKGDDEHASWCTLYVAVTEGQLSKGEAIIKFSGRWWRRDPTGDQKVQEDVTLAVGNPLGDIFITNGEYGSNLDNDTPSYIIAWNKKEDGAYIYRTVSLYGANNTYVVSVNDIGMDAHSSSFYLNVNDSGFDLNNSETYKVVQSCSPLGISINGDSLYPNVEYKKESNLYTRPAYPQLSGPLNAEFDYSTRKLRVSWTIGNAPTENYITDYFKLLITTGGTTKTEEIAYVGGTNQYAYEMELEEGMNADYHFEVYRSHTETYSVWRSTFGKDTTIHVNTSHLKIIPESVAIQLSEDQKTATITWDTTGSAWSSGSKFVITRFNMTSGASEEIALTKEDLLKKEYVDKMIRLCNAYRYKLAVIPNENYGTIPAIHIDDDITPVEIGSVDSIFVSKGYYSDRVEISWYTTGGFDEFSIRRKQYGSPDSEYKQIATMNGSNTQSTYLLRDEVGLPGVVYEYQVFGLVNCADSIHISDNKPVDIGFRTPTGDIYGRVTFDNGQGVGGVLVSATTEDEIDVNSLRFAAGQTATVHNPGLLKQDTDSVTLQAWVKPEGTGGTQSVISKKGMYELGIKDDRVYFRAGDREALSKTKVSEIQSEPAFFHLTGVYAKDSLLVYINGKPDATLIATATVTGNDNPVELGGGDFAGVIDEVRVWSSALPASDIERDYIRYLTGGEKFLTAYWTFNYATRDAFYDISYASATYHANDGALNGVTLSADPADRPTASQLGYKGVTATDGSYSIRAIPYKGNGTPYTIIPTFGIHQFESQKEVRNIGPSSQSHTVNFLDKSSFKVKGSVIYAHSTIPVKGANFYIDGVMAIQSNGSPQATDERGEFAISVPVGTHEVKVAMANHVFEGGGRITDPYGNDLNYQDSISGIRFTDHTTIKYIGRVAGGAVQEAYPLGHSLSKNNLAKGIKVALTYPNAAYQFGIPDENGRVQPYDTVYNHFLPSNKTKAYSNKVNFKENTLTVFPNDTTGEFVAYVIPEVFTVSVDAPGHGNLHRETVDLTQKFSMLEEVYAYTDSTQNEQGDWEKTAYSDTVFFQHQNKFIKRVNPTARISQLDETGAILPYFGSDTIVINKLTGALDTIPLRKNDRYNFGMPVFEQYRSYTFNAEVFEKYVFYDEKGAEVEGVADEVPSTDAEITFTNGFLTGDENQTVIALDENGTGDYTFTPTKLNLTDGISSISASIQYGGESASSTFAWEPPASFKNGNGYLTGGEVSQGSDFVTAGPDKVLMVLRDPPGSKSYSFIEKGTRVSETSTYTGSVKNAGSEDVTLGVKLEVITFTGIGAGVITKMTETELGSTIGIKHEEQYEGQDGKKKVTTTTTRFQTSDDPLYVGENGDVYVGYSTNISFAKTAQLTFKKEPGSEDVEIKGSEDQEWNLVKTSGNVASQSFNTLFAYPQVHIENRLIPELERGRNRLFNTEFSEQEMRDYVAQHPDTVLYRSLFPAGHEYFGLSNDDPRLDYLTTKPEHDYYNGPSYQVIKVPDKSTADTIAFINQAIQNWKDRIAENEKEKAKAQDLLSNYSFHAGSPVEYSESYTETDISTHSFYLMLGGKIASNLSTLIGGGTMKLELEETVETQHGGSWESEQEASQSKGFVLAEDGDDDYLSVDVLREGNTDDKTDDKTDDYLGGYIFRTRGGATSCPYEGAAYSKYYEPGTKLSEGTMQIEVPRIAFKDGKNFIENVPSGETAKLTLVMTNESEIDEDVRFQLSVIEASNPKGAKFSIDGGAIGNGRLFVVPAGGSLVKTLEVGKGDTLKYDNLQLVLHSECQYDPTSFLEDIADTVAFSVHFSPSCTNVNLKEPADNWVYNTKLPVIGSGADAERYMDVALDGFDVNYSNFNRIELQYKPASDATWTTLISYYNNQALYEQAIEDGKNAQLINAQDAGKIAYQWKMDALPDMLYDLRAVSVCMNGNDEVFNESEVHRGIKDTYNPRLFGTPQPADGILAVGDEIRLNFNEPIAEGLLSKNNFQVRGIRNGSVSDHSVSVSFDGLNDYAATEFEKNLAGKDMTVEMWIQEAKPQDATLFSHGNINESLELSMTADRHLNVRIGNQTFTSAQPVDFDQGSWAHVAFVYDAGGGYLSAYYNYKEVIAANEVASGYNGIGNVVVGKSIAREGYALEGKIHNLRIWEKKVAAKDLQLNSLQILSGIEAGLMGYYPMDEGRGTLCADKARGANLIMQGCDWAMPDGYAATTNGADYLEIAAGSAAFTEEMDYTVEFWFRAEPGQRNATLLSNGRGDGQDFDSKHVFSVGFDETGTLAFCNNGTKTSIEGDYQDNDWHHFALAVNRTLRRGQVYMDGKLHTFIDATLLGGISSSFLYLGARGWYSPEDSGTLIVDQHFRGSVDELRFWESYRNESLIAENNHTKLSGEEAGLVHYYPFDTYITHQGIKYLEFTGKDMRIASGLNPETDSCRVVGGSVDNVKSKNIPPIKDAGPVADLDFDYVANNDALILTLNEAEYKVAKTIVTFTAMDIRDVNGNPIESPVTWSAYIDKNQLKWSEDRLTLEKELYEEMSLTVRISNNGGSIQNYTIGNAPSWLEVTPSAGVLNPSSYQEVVLTIDEGLNVGTYEEVIYLTNEDNVSEALFIDLAVKGEKPDWSVDPNDYKYNMTVFGKMRFNNIYSSDEEDILAAFDQEGRCVGLANSSYDKLHDMWYTFLTVYGNEKQSDYLEFRMWDASAGKTCQAQPDRDIRFVNDAVEGTAMAPVVFDGREILYQDIALVKGWNWISFNLTSDKLSDVGKTLARGSWTADDYVKSFEYTDNYSTQYGWTGQLSANGGFNNTAAFALHSSKEQVLSVEGLAVDIKNTPIPVSGKQWNYISYLPQVNFTVREAMAGYDAKEEDLLKSQDLFAMFSGTAWVGSLNYMQKNKGYMLFRNAEGNTSFIYPSHSGILNVRSAALPAEGYVNTDYAENMSIIAASPAIRSGDRIHSYVDGVWRGRSEAVACEGGELHFMNVTGSNTSDEEVSFALVREGEVVGYSVTKVAYESNSRVGSLDEPLLLDFNDRPGTTTAYPNPFADKVKIITHADESDRIGITIYDVVGRTVKQYPAATAGDSVYSVEWDASGHASGIYIVHVVINGETSFLKIEKK